jgi:hypothetical protein
MSKPNDYTFPLVRDEKDKGTACADSDFDFAFGVAVGNTQRPEGDFEESANCSLERVGLQTGLVVNREKESEGMEVKEYIHAL